MRLGCNLRPKGLKAPLSMSKYLDDLPPAPRKVYREYRIPEDAWGVFGNDTIGDCTCASIAHMLMLVTAHTGKLVVPEEKDVIEFYSAVSGYDPATGANDNGADLPTVLNRWRDVGLSGHKIEQWGDIDPLNIEAQKHGIHIFGAVDDAVYVTDAAMDQFENHESWSIVPTSPIDGGHSIPRFGYGSKGFSCVTWGRNQKGNTGWWLRYLMECCVVITKDWLNEASGLTPSGFDMDALVADLKMLRV